MKQFVKVVTGALGVIVLGSVVSLVPQNTPQGQGRGAAPVNVAQVSVASVPVSGAVRVSNFPAVLTGAVVPVKQSAPRFVTLCWGCQDPATHVAQPFFAQVHTDGQTVDTTPFALEQGQQLVVTDVSWSADCVVVANPPNCPPPTGENVTFQLGNAVLSFGSANGGGASKSEHLTGGLVLTQLPEPLASIGFPFAGLVIVNGYLVP